MIKWCFWKIKVNEMWNLISSSNLSVQSLETVLLLVYGQQNYSSVSLQWLWTDYLSGNKGTLPTLDVSQKVWMSFLLHPAEIRAHVVWLRSRLPRLLFWLGSHSVCPHWLEEQHSVLTLWTQACHPSGQKTKVRTMANNIYIYISIYLCCSFILTHFNAATYISTVIVALCLSNTSISSFIMVEGILQRPH